MTLITRGALIKGVAMLTLASCTVGANAWAQATYPTRPISLIVPFPAGGVTDVVARELAHRLGTSLGQPVVVVNRAGAGGYIGTQVLSQSAPDGYTLGVLTVSAMSIGPHLNRKLPFDPAKDFTPISNLVNTPGALIAGPGTPFDSFAGLVKYAKANPGKVTYASVGTGSIPHLTAEMLAKTARINILHVPYKGAAPAMQDLLATHVDLSFETSLVTTMSAHADRRIKVLAITGPKRVAVLPDVPTVAEHGYPDFGVQGWFGLFGPSGLPQSQVDKLNKAAAEAFANPTLQRRLDELGMQSNVTSPQEFRQFLDHQDRTWGKLIKDLNIKLD